VRTEERVWTRKGEGAGEGASESSTEGCQEEVANSALAEGAGSVNAAGAPRGIEGRGDADQNEDGRDGGEVDGKPLLGALAVLESEELFEDHSFRGIHDFDADDAVRLVHIQDDVFIHTPIGHLPRAFIEADEEKIVLFVVGDGHIVRIGS
jgi:hypothetical protein